MAICLNELFLEIISGILGKGGTVPYLLKIPITPETVVGARMPLSDLSRLISVLSENGRPKGAFFAVVFASRVRTFHSHGSNAISLVSGEQTGP